MGKDKARETARYWPLRRRFIEDHPFCEFPTNAPADAPEISCSNRTTSIHHMKGQDWRIMNDMRWWLATCHGHHAWIEDHKNEARKRGLILYK